MTTRSRYHTFGLRKALKDYAEKVKNGWVPEWMTAESAWFKKIEKQIKDAKEYECPDCGRRKIPAGERCYLDSDGKAMVHNDLPRKELAP